MEIKTQGQIQPGRSPFLGITGISDCVAASCQHPETHAKATLNPPQDGLQGLLQGGGRAVG